MIDDFNIRPYIRVLLRYWFWLFAGAILAAGLAFLFYSLTPGQYEATTLIAISEPRQEIQFDPRINSTNANQSVSAFPDLAISDEVLGLLQQQLLATLESTEDLQPLRRRLTAEIGPDESLLRLTVSHEEPATSALIANLWSEIFVDWVNQLYGNQGQQQLLFFEEQLGIARLELKSANIALVDFELENRSLIIENEIATLQLQQIAYLEQLAEFGRLNIEIAAMRSRVESTDISYADQVTLLFLQLRVFGEDPGEALQLELGAEGVVSVGSNAAMLEQLDGLSGALVVKEEAVAVALTQLEPLLLAKQAELQRFAAEAALLDGNVTVADEAVLALARKVEEEKITAQDETNGVRLASVAALPGRPAGPGQLIVMVIAGILGGSLSGVTLLSLHWWRDE